MRGEIRNREFAKTLRDFSSLRWGKVTPTDIDGFVEFGDKVFIFIEAKFGASTLQYGQRLALERLVDAVGNVRHALLVICRHDCGPDEDIAVGDCVVTQYRSSKLWRIPPSGITVKQIIDKFKEKCDRLGKEGNSGW